MLRRTPMQKTMLCFFFQAEDGIRDLTVTGVQTCALPILRAQLNDGPALCIADRLIVPVGPATAFLQSIHAQLAVTLNPLVGRLAADAVAPAQLAQRRTTAQVVGYEEQFLVHGCALLPGHGDRSLAAVGSSCQAWICYPCRSEEHTSELQSQSNLVCR